MTEETQETARPTEGETLDNVSQLAAIGWTDGEIATYLGLSKIEYENRMVPGDGLYEAVTKGRLERRAEIEIRVARLAASGDPDSVKQWREIARDKTFSVSKLDLFGGPDKEGTFQRIVDYVSSGSKGGLSDKEAIYVDILTLIYSLDGRYGKRRTIRFLTSEPFGFSFGHASDMYKEAMEMFYSRRKISKSALRAKMADEFDTLYVAAREAAQSAKDYEIASNILANKARALQLDKDDPQALPPEAYSRPFRVLSLSPEAIGLPAANRQELARQIDGIVAPEAVKRRLKMDAGVSDMDVMDILESGNELQEES